MKTKTAKSLGKKTLCLMLSLIMVICMIPTVAFAGHNVTDGSTLPSKLITEYNNAYVAWNTELTADMKNVTSNASIIGDNVFYLAGNKLHKVDKNTGEILATSSVTVDNLYNYFLVNDGNKLYIQTGKTVTAFNQDLTKAWVSEIFSGVQGLSRIYVEDGKLYGATVDTKAAASGGDVAEYFCLNVSDGSKVWSYEVAATEKGGVNKNYNGCYWSGADVLGNYVLFGSENGKVYSFNKDTGAVVDTLELGTTISIRSQITSVGNNIYFTGNSSFSAGKVYKVNFDSTAGKFGTKIESDNIGNSIATPTLYKNRLYIAGGGNIYVLNAEDLTQIYKITASKQKIHDIEIVADTVTGDVYGFSTYYAKPGSVIGFKDKVGQTAANYFDLAGVTKNIADQYSATQLTVGADGTLYMVNDTGKLVALTRNEAYLTSLEAKSTTTSDTYALTNAFNASMLENELVVPQGTKSVEFNVSASANDKVTLDGKTVTDGKIVAEFDQLPKNITFKVVDGTALREYELAVREASSEVGINVATANANNIATAAKVEVIEAADNYYIIDNVVKNENDRTIIGLKDSNATIEWKILSGTEKTLSNSVKERDGIEYHKYVYWGSSYAGTTTAKLTVTAEDGVTKEDYFFVVTTEAVESKPSITVNISLSDSGKFVTSKDGSVVANQPLEVKDLNENGVITMDETLKAAHEKFYEGGSVAGYDSAYGTYGLSITKLWGDVSGCFGYWNGKVSGYSLDDEVANGDDIKAFIYADKSYWSDKYTLFEQKEYTVTEDKDLTVKLLAAGYDEDWNTVFAGCEGANITVEGAKTKTNITTDKDGNAVIKFAKAGTYNLVASKADGSIVPSMCTVTVEASDEDNSTQVGGTTNNGTTNDDASNNSAVETPKTGDTADLGMWTLVALAGGAGVIALRARRREDENQAA